MNVGVFHVPGFKTNALIVIIWQLFHPFVWLVWQTCSYKAEFSCPQRKNAFCIGTPLNVYQTDVWFVRYIRVRSFCRAGVDMINRVGPLLPLYTTLGLGEDIPLCLSIVTNYGGLKRILSNLNIVASPTFFLWIP